MTRTSHRSDDDDGTSNSPNRSRRSRLHDISLPGSPPASSDLITIQDPSLILPQRSIERRQNFQRLTQRYNNQLLYGCSNPNCSTSTCLSYQRRKAKGPFRPYTVLSARALATFLASQDHPERGLCPHATKPHINHGAPVVKQVEIALPTQGLPKPSSPAPKLGDPAVEGEIVSVKVDGEQRPRSRPTGAFRGRWPSLQRIHDSIWGENSTSEARTDHETLVEAEPNRMKDPKSFAQNLFDTTAMKSLHTDLESMRNRKLAPRNENPSKDKVVSESREPADEKGDGSQNCVSHHDGSLTDKEIVQAKLDRSPPPSKETHQTSGTLCRLEDTPSNASSKLDFSPEHSRQGLLKAASTISQISHASPLESASPSTIDVASCGNLETYKERMNSNVFLPSWRESPVTVDGQINSNQMIFDSPVNGAESPIRGRPIESVQSLQYLSYSNIESFIERHKLDILDGTPHEIGLRCFGRFYSNIARFEIGSGQQWSHADPRNFLCQSVTYVCSTPEALLKSFLDHRYEGNTLFAKSADFRQMSTSFRKLVRADITHSTIFAGLWTSLRSVFATHVDDTKPLRGGQSVDNPAKTCRFEELNDTEAAHIVKITFAALNSTIPYLYSKEQEALQGARSFGLTTAFGIAQIPPRDRRQLSIVQEAMDSFEDDMAISLVTRLCKAIATRKYAMRTGRHRPARFLEAHDLDCRCADFVTLAARNILDDKTMEQQVPLCGSVPSIRGGLLQDHLKPYDSYYETRDLEVGLTIEWLRTVILKNWDCQSTVPRAGPVDGALELLGSLYTLSHWIGFPEQRNFSTPFLAQRLDSIDMPIQWAGTPSDSARLHLLSYAFLFPAQARVTYFRAINHHTMNTSFEQSVVNKQLLGRLDYGKTSEGPGKIRLQDRLERGINKNLVLEVRRDNVLADAMNHLWRCRPSDLLKPLKVRMGMDEGEMGVDHGGVQQEFFRIALGEALDPQFGAFATDSRTNTSWFQPFSLEPLHKFELIGLLVGLAVYNGLTLPVTFPYVMYVHMIGLPIPLNDLDLLEPGWPDLVDGLRALISWKDGDVADVFMRTYTFSLDVFGTKVDIDMDANLRRRDRQMQHMKTSSSPEETISDPDEGTFAQKALPFIKYSSARTAVAVPLEEEEHNISGDSDFGTTVNARPTRADVPILNYRADSPTPSTPMVTNANRQQYVADYVEYLTLISVSPQLKAFLCGFHRCIGRKSLSLFDVITLRNLVEGHQDIDTYALQRITRYEGGYHAGHHIIVDFWNIVHGWAGQEELGQGKIRSLLEFVTASDRLPVGGVDRMTFVIQRNGRGNDRLPTSLTCFGRLLLPQYTSYEALKTGIERAIEESRGFGTP